MLKNYLQIASRNLVKNRSHTLINIGGLTLGIVCALVIFLVIRFEYSFDTHHKDSDRIYRIVRETIRTGDAGYDPGVPYPLPEAVRNDFPEIKDLTIVDSNYETPVLSVEETDGSTRKIKEEYTAFVQTDYFNLFTYDWLAGTREVALERPNTAVISQSLAQKLFENENPVGRNLTLHTSNKYDLEITGIIQDPPLQTDMPFVLMASFESLDREGNRRAYEIVDEWGSVSTSVQCYLKLPEGASPEMIESRLDTMMNKYRDNNVAGIVDHLLLQPLNKLHSDTRFETYSGRTVSEASLMALALVGFFLLIAACINFINLNTATAVKRSREVGVRKALGGTRLQLALHFLGETALITFFSLIMAAGLTEITLHYMRPVLGYVLEFNLLADHGILLFLGLLLVVITFFAGLYPALYLSGFNAIEAIRNRITASYGKGLILRRGLVIFQFAISIALIICTVVISMQMNYFRTVDMGFVREAVVEIPIPVWDKTRLETFRNRLDQETAINNFSYSNTGTAHGNVWGGNYKLRDDSELKEGNGQVKYVDTNFLDTYGIELLAGHNIIESDTVNQYMVNETLARKVGYGERYEELIGKTIEIWGKPAPIVGIVKDFHTGSLHSDLSPVLISARSQYVLAGIKIDVQRTQEALTRIEQSFEAAFPDYIFEYTFLDNRIADFYKQEQRTAQLMNTFTIIAILIGCLGLLGLVSYMTTTRTKEIGVRKVLGATIPDILKLFIKEFLALIIIAFMIAAPAAWFFMRQWLADFSYQIDLGLEIFGIALLGIVGIALATVAYKSVRAAYANPVESLRSE